MVSVETGCGAEGAVTLWGLSTKASVNMITLDDGNDGGGDAVVPQKDNRGTFCSTVALFEAV